MTNRPARLTCAFPAVAAPGCARRSRAVAFPGVPERTTCHVVEASYAEGAAEKRVPFREEHLERMRKLAGEGAVVLAGAFEDMSASLLILALESEEAVAAVVESDVYWREGIWTGYRVRRLTRVV